LYRLLQAMPTAAGEEVEKKADTWRVWTVILIESDSGQFSQMWEGQKLVGMLRNSNKVHIAG